jgi:hypothetical protein
LALVQILSPGGARGIYLVLPTVKKTPDDIIEKSADIKLQSQVTQLFPLNLTSIPYTRTLLNYGQIVCKLVALSQWTPLYAGQHVTETIAIAQIPRT